MSEITPQIAENISNSVFSYRQPNLTYRMSENGVKGKINGLDAIKQAVYHILMTERYAETIYDSDYGVELNQYIGQDVGFITASIQDTLRDALLQDDRITDVIVNDVSKSDKENNACKVEFTVYTIYGEYDEELNI